MLTDQVDVITNTSAKLVAFLNLGDNPPLLLYPFGTSYSLLVPMSQNKTLFCETSMSIVGLQHLPQLYTEV